MLVEVFFGMLHFSFIDKAHMSETAVGKLIDDGTSQPVGQIVVDDRSDICTESSEQYYEINIHLIVYCCFVGGRRHDHFGRKRNKRTLDGH